MIVVFHENYLVKEVIDQSNSNLINTKESNIVHVLKELSFKHENQWIVWVDYALKDYVNYNKIPELLIHNRLMLSFHPYGNYLGDEIGYVDYTGFIKVNKKVRYISGNTKLLTTSIHRL